jgi:predicted transcriptional regulator
VSLTPGFRHWAGATVYYEHSELWLRHKAKHLRGGDVHQRMTNLGPLEAVIMERLWASKGPMAVREVLEDLQRDRSVAYTTVMTVMDNLHRKGLLSRERVGRAFHYTPVQSRDEHTAVLMGEVLADSGDRGSALLHFVEQMPPEELARLREALDQRTTDGSDRG